jgi:hypothetical protein
MVIGKKLKPHLHCTSSDVKPLTELPSHFSCRIRARGMEDDNVKVFRQERKLVIYLAYVAKEMSNMTTIFELLTANLENHELRRDT